MNQNYKVTEGMFARTNSPEVGFDNSYHAYVNNKLERLEVINLRVLDANGILDEHFEVTPLGNEIISDFNTLNR